METLADYWAAYAAQVLPPNAGAVQAAETRQAFYAGAAVGLSLLSSALKLPTVEGTSVMHAVAAELDQHMQEVQHPARPQHQTPIQC